MEEIVKEVLEGAMKGDALSIAYLVVSVLVIIMAIVALVMKILIAVRYWKANKMPISSRMTGAEAARFVLDKDGLTHIKVKKAGIIRGVLFGNYYNVFTKTIYLRSILFKIDDKKSVTATAFTTLPSNGPNPHPPISPVTSVTVRSIRRSGLSVP